MNDPALRIAQPETTEPRLAPAGEAFPSAPASWYLIGRSRDLRERPISVEVLGRQLAIFRTPRGVAALEATCSHMGADLSRGRVIGGRLQCPFHGWEYDNRGRCTKIPAQAEIPEFACQQSFPVAEWQGLLFVFMAPVPSEPLFELPELLPPAAQPLVASRATRYTMDCPWYVFAANGFDLQHFALVHDRELIGEPEVTCPSRFARRIRFCSRVTGTSLPDRLIRTFAGETVDVTITAWAGNLVSVIAKFPRATSRVVFSTQPAPGDRTAAQLLVFIEQGSLWRRWLDPLDLLVRRAMTMTFIRDDTLRIRQALYRPATLIEADRTMIDYFHWLAALPQTRKDDA